MTDAYMVAGALVRTAETELKKLDLTNKSEAEAIATARQAIDSIAARATQLAKRDIVSKVRTMLDPVGISAMATPRTPGLDESVAAGERFTDEDGTDLYME